MRGHLIALTRSPICNLHFAFCNLHFAIAYNSPMPRTFSLARLMLGITAFCLVCGLVVNYPELAIALASAIICIAAVLCPTMFITLALVNKANHRGTLIFVAFVGAVYGIAARLSLFPLWWTLNHGGDAFFMSLAIPPALGAFITGTAFVLIERYRRRFEP